MSTIYRKDVDSLAKKLETFAKDLPQQEKNVLDWLMARAKAVPEGEISGAELEAVSGGLTDALGFTENLEAIEVTGGVKWSR